MNYYNILLQHEYFYWNVPIIAYKNGGTLSLSETCIPENTLRAAVQY